MAEIEGEGVARDNPSAEVIGLLQSFHRQYGDVGGVFNAYEKAVHFGILAEAYRKGWWSADQEVSTRPGKCDLVLPIRGGGRLWLEVKLWWFLRSPEYTWVTLPKMSRSPIDDWNKLHDRVREPKDLRAVLLMRTWDAGPGAKEEADAWLANIRAEFDAMEGSRRPRELAHGALDAVEKPRPILGDVNVWW